MAKIDVTKIEGFEEMSAEDKLNALLDYEFETPEPVTIDRTEELDRLKASLSKSNSEVAEYKRKLQEKMTADERAEEARKEAEKTMREELESLRREKTVSSYVTSLMGVGYDANTASKMASSLPDGISMEFFDSQKAFLEQRESQIKADALKEQPTLSVGTPPTTNTVQDQEYAQMRKWAGLKD